MRARDLLGQIITILLERLGNVHLIASRDVRTIDAHGMRITITVHIESTEGAACTTSTSRLSLRTSRTKQGRTIEA